MIAACLACCSPHRGQPHGQVAKPPQHDTAVGAPAVTAVAVPIVPERLVGKLGSVRVVVAMDNTRPDSYPLAGLLPEALTCSRGLIHSADVLVGMVSRDDDVSLFATGVDEASVRSCLPELVRVAGIASREVDGALAVTIFGRDYAITWDGSMMSIEPLGWHLPDRPSTPLQRERFAMIPPDARIWAFATGFPPVSVGVDDMTAWLTRPRASAQVTVFATGDDEALEKALGGMVRGMRRQAQARGMTFDEGWLTMSTASRTATVTLTLPGELLEGLESAP